MSFKHPVSVLVVIYAEETKRVLMLQRRDDPEFWQSVTGSWSRVKARCRPPRAKSWKRSISMSAQRRIVLLTASARWNLKFSVIYVIATRRV